MFLPLLAAAAPLLGGLASGAASLFGQSSANQANREINAANNAFNASEAEKSREYQTAMSNTAYQRASEDMKKAGLNPMLAYQQGGAGTPSGATASASAAAPMQDALGKGVSTAIDTLRLKNELDQANADISLKKAQGITQIETANREKNSARQAEAQAKTLEAELPAKKAKSALDQKTYKYDEIAAPMDAITKRVGNLIGNAASATSVYNNLKSPKIINTGLPSGAREIP